MPNVMRQRDMDCLTESDKVPENFRAIYYLTDRLSLECVINRKHEVEWMIKSPWNNVKTDSSTAAALLAGQGKAIWRTEE